MKERSLAASVKKALVGIETGQGWASVSILSMQSKRPLRAVSQARSFSADAPEACQILSPPNGTIPGEKDALQEELNLTCV